MVKGNPPIGTFGTMNNNISSESKEAAQEEMGPLWDGGGKPTKQQVQSEIRWDWKGVTEEQSISLKDHPLWCYFKG